MSVAPARVPRPTSRASSRGPRPQLRVLRPPRHTRRYVVTALMVAALGIFGIVSLNALAAQAAFQARSLEAEVNELSLRHDELTAEVAALSAPGRVRQVAREELGMVPAAAAGFLIADPEEGAEGVAPERTAVAQGEEAAQEPSMARSLERAEAVQQALGEG